MATEWYYSKDGQQVGPVSANDLKQLVAGGKLQSADQIWKKGMADWVPVSSVKGLFPLPPSPPQHTPPPPPPPERNPSSESSQHDATEKFGFHPLFQPRWELLLKTVVLTKATAFLQQTKDYAQSEAVQSRLAALRHKWESLSKNQRLGVLGGSMGVLGGSVVVGLIFIMLLFSLGSDGRTDNGVRAGSDFSSSVVKSSSSVVKSGKHYDRGFRDGAAMANRFVNANLPQEEEQKILRKELATAERGRDGAQGSDEGYYQGLCNGLRSVMVKHGVQ